MITDALIALWFVSMFAVGAYAYFRGAKAQLRECAKHRYSGCWMNDQDWLEHADISNRKRFPRMNR